MLCSLLEELEYKNGRYGLIAMSGGGGVGKHGVDIDLTFTVIDITIADFIENRTVFYVWQQLFHYLDEFQMSIFLFVFFYHHKQLSGKEIVVFSFIDEEGDVLAEFVAVSLSGLLQGCRRISSGFLLQPRRY